MSRRLALFALLLTSSWSVLLHARESVPIDAIASAPANALEVAVITYGPGEIYWERFGHDAIELVDTRSGAAVAFHYGMFDFSQENFLLRFARGEMLYSIDAVRARPNIRWYASQGRGVRRQVLALNPAQRDALRDALLVNLAPGHRRYHYDYFLANCATKLRDALDSALGGSLREQWSARDWPGSFRSHTRRLLSPQSALMLLVDIGLGPSADQPLNAWQASFVPMILAELVAESSAGAVGAPAQPLVLGDRKLAPRSLPPVPDAAPKLLLPLAIAGIGLAMLLLATGWPRASRPARIAFAVLSNVFVALAGLVGLLLLVLWTLTAHEVAWANRNLLQFSPLALLLLVGVSRPQPGHFTRTLTVVLAACTVLAALLQPWGWLGQQNLPWIAFAAPPWLALVAVHWRRAHV